MAGRNKIKGIMYYRVSTEDQAQFGVSLEQQRKQCQSYADMHDIEIIKIFHDDGVSAKTVDRPSLQGMLKFCGQKSNGVEVVIVYKIDRLTRNVNDYSSILMLLSKLGVKLISTTEAIDSTPIGKFIGNVMAANAQLDNDIRSQRVSACMREKIEQGIWCWKAPYGYLNARDGLSKKIITVDKKRAPMIKFIFREYATELYTVEDVRVKVNKMGLRSWSGKEISPQLMNKIMTNKFYIGIMTSRGEEFEGTHEKLVDRQTFFKCQNLLNGKSRGDNVSESQASEDFPLRHFAVCAYCGRPLTAYISTGRWGGKYPYYRCYNRNCSSKKSIAKKKIEDDFRGCLQEITPKDKFLNGFKAVVLDVWEKQYKRINEDKKDRDKQIEALKEDKMKLIDMKKKDLLSDEDFREAFDRIKKEIEAKEGESPETKMEEFNIDEAVEFVFDYIKYIPETWKGSDLKQQLVLQGLIFPEKPIYDYSSFQTPKLCPILQAKKELAGASSSVVASRGIGPLLSG